jgi:translation initiation factor 2B subunit (eIF-2B alpha/beta/delta family)
VEGQLLEALAAASPSDVDGVVASLPVRLRERFPQMANLMALARELEPIGAAGEPAIALAALVARRREERRTSGERLYSVLLPHLPAGDLLVFTLSKSGTVASVLGDLHRAGRRLCVLVAESRPGAEGARLARELSESGIRCRACDDLLLLSLVPPEAAPRRPAGYLGSPVVLVGADAVYVDALVNKVGTRALLETARHAGVPALVLATVSKLRPDEAPKGLGSLFETIPRDGTLILTEAGPVPSD